MRVSVAHQHQVKCIILPLSPKSAAQGPSVILTVTSLNSSLFILQLLFRCGCCFEKKGFNATP